MPRGGSPLWRGGEHRGQVDAAVSSDRQRRTGQMGGHKPKAIAGAHRNWLIARCQGDDFTLRGLVAELAGRGLKVDYRSVWKFVHAEGLSFKKTVLAREQDRPTSPVAALSGAGIIGGLILPA